MSEKKTLHNVWLIQDKVPIDESADNVPVDDSDDSEIKPKYFAGLAISEVTGNQVSRFEPLSAATKVYKNEKGAKIGARMADKYYESPFITPVFVEYAEFDVLEEPPKSSPPAPKERRRVLLCRLSLKANLVVGLRWTSFAATIR